MGPRSLRGASVGASGWSYPSWRPGWYPADARPEEFLRLYAERLPAVEANSTFYRLPSQGQLETWAGQTPPGFRFAPKLPRSISHDGRLGGVDAFSSRILSLGERLGPVRVLLPDERPRDDGLLAFLLGSFDPAVRLALDLRHPTWDDPAVAERLAEAGAVRVGELGGAAPFVYVRLRETPYDDASLAAWAGRLRPVLDAGREVYAFVRHEDAPTAPVWAARLLELLAT